MFNIGPGELIAILSLALIVLGPQRLPEAVRTFGRVVGELRRISSGFQEELRNALDDSEVERDIDRLRASTRVEQPEPPALPGSDVVDVGEVAPSAPGTDDEKDSSIDDDDPELPLDETPAVVTAETELAVEPALLEEPEPADQPPADDPPSEPPVGDERAAS